MQPDTRASRTRAAVWIVEDDADYRQTVKQLINDDQDLHCPQVFGSGEDLLAFLKNHLAPDVILADIGLPGMSGIEIVKRVREFSPATRLVMLTIHEDNERILSALLGGATGYLDKSATPDQILGAIREVLRGGAPMTPEIRRRVLNLFIQLHAPRGDYGLTDREHDVLAKLVEGKAKKQIAHSLSLSVHTVDTHLRSIYAKLHVHSMTAAVAKAVTENLVSSESDD